MAVSAHASLPEDGSGIAQRFASDGQGGQYFAHTSYKLLGPDRRSPPPELFTRNRQWFW